MPEQIDHPVLITECVCNPIQSRSKMAELLFETYGVPSIGINTLLILTKRKKKISSSSLCRNLKVGLPVV